MQAVDDPRWLEYVTEVDNVRKAPLIYLAHEVHLVDALGKIFLVDAI
jgi:hypothetical protein